MVSFAENRADVFTPQSQRSITSTMQSADVLARKERYEAISLPQPRRFTIRLPVEGGPIDLIYTSFDNSLPKWAKPVLASLTDRWGVLPGWDSYQAKPTDPQLVLRLLNILSDLMQDTSLPPQITPLADGGVQAEWHHNQRDLEIVVSAADEPTYYYYDQVSGQEEEGDLDPNYARVQDLIGEIS